MFKVTQYAHNGNLNDMMMHVEFEFQKYAPHVIAKIEEHPVTQFLLLCTKFYFAILRNLFSDDPRRIYVIVRAYQSLFQQCRRQIKPFMSFCFHGLEELHYDFQHILGP